MTPHTTRESPAPCSLHPYISLKESLQKTELEPAIHIPQTLLHLGMTGTLTAEHVNRDHRTSSTPPSVSVAKASPAGAQTPCPAPSHPRHGETPGTRWGPPRGTLVAPRFVSQQLGGRRQGAWGQGEGHRTPETGLRC